METRNNISFKASLAGTTKVLRDINGTWQEVDAALIKLNPRLKVDMDTLEILGRRWGSKNMAGAIAEEASICKDPVYAISLQRFGLKRPNASEILGILSTDKIDKTTETVNIYKIGVHPAISHEAKGQYREFKNIGTTLMKSFVNFLNTKEKNVKKVVLESEYPAQKFYKKLHMIENPEASRLTQPPAKVFELPKEKFTEFSS